jgi:lipoprotein-anchoring transpeptidase ErfK/SrfK
MSELSRRVLLLGGSITVASGFASRAVAQSTGWPFWNFPRPVTPPGQVRPPSPMAAPPSGAQSAGGFQAMYGPVYDEPFPVPAAPLSKIGAVFLRQEVAYPGREPEGTIVIDPRAHFLYHVHGGGQATRYGVGVGRQGFAWSGAATINSKQEWPDWYPPKEMIDRQPSIRRQVTQLQSGLGVPGGSRNPLGARALYLWQNNKDTLYRIHGTLEPQTIGQSVSSGCIRMINQDVIYLYNQVSVGTKVVVLR